MPRVWCDHCNKPQHTREPCWKLHGKPTNWKSSKQGERNSLLDTLNANVGDSNLFSKEQIDQILKLLKATSSSRNPSVSLAQSGKFPQALSCINSSPWINDSEASDHMTNSSSLFASYSPIYCNEKIRIANGSFTHIVRKETIHLTTKLTLHYVFHVLKLACNLLSVSKISKDANWRVVFFDTHCTSQDQNSGETIGCARMIGGVYYFDEVSASHKQVQDLSSVCSCMLLGQLTLIPFIEF